MLSDIFGADCVESERTYDWLRNPETGHLLYVDFVVERQKLCFEYDGAQHFIPTRFFYEDGRAFEAAKRRDEIKQVLLEKRGYKLIHITYKEKITRELVEEKIKTIV